MLNKREWLQIVSVLGLILMVLAGFMSGFVPYIAQFLFLVYIFVYSRKANPTAFSRKLIVVLSIVMIMVRLMTFTSPLDLVDLALWISIVCLTAF